MAIKALGIDHIHFNTRDIRRFSALMRELFELEPARLGHIKGLEKYNTTLHLAGAPRHHPFLDVFEPTALESPIAEEMMETGEGVSYVCFRVADIEAAAAHAAKCGLREISRDGFGEGMKQRQYDTLDLLGFRLELVEYGPQWEGELANVKARMAAGETVETMRYVDEATQGA